MSEISMRLRREFAAQDAVRDAGLTAPEDIEHWDDIAYGAHPLQRLDVYRLKRAAGRLPVIVNVHGGGWVYGSKELYRYYAMSLAQRGFAVVNFSYRLAPEEKFPAQLEDVAHAFAWTEENADTYGLDMDALFAVGDSAGAHLLGLYCVAATNAECTARPGMRFGPVPRGISLACGVYTVGRDTDTDVQTRLLMEDLLPGGPTPEALETIDVRRWITPAFPETFFFTCTGDFLQGQARALQRTLMERAVPHVLRYYGDAERALGHVFHCNLRLEAGRRCNDEQCAFFRSLIER